MLKFLYAAFFVASMWSAKSTHIAYRNMVFGSEIPNDVSWTHAILAGLFTPLGTLIVADKGQPEGLVVLAYLIFTFFVVIANIDYCRIWNILVALSLATMVISQMVFNHPYDMRMVIPAMVSIPFIFFILLVMVIMAAISSIKNKR